MKNLKVIFMGTPKFAAVILEDLIQVCDIIAVVSQPDRLKDKKGNLVVPEVKEVASKYNIDVFQPLKIREEYEDIINYNPDIIITCAYGQIIPKEILEIPKYGCINIHASILPKYRGGAPIHHSLINGDEETGITIMYMDEAMDEGDIIKQKSIKILPEDNLESLFDKLSILGKDLIISTLPEIITGTNSSIKQNDNEATYAYNIKKDLEKIDFTKSSVEVHNLIRGLYKNPGAYFILDNKRVKVFNSYVLENVEDVKINCIYKVNEDGIFIGCGQNSAIVLTDIGVAGKKRMLVRDYIKGIKTEDMVSKFVNC